MINKDECEKNENVAYENLKEALIQVKGMREGRLEKQNIKEVIDELNNDESR